MQSEQLYNFSKEPSFKHTGLDSVITEFALALEVRCKDEMFASGTAVIVAPYLAITARHVITDFWDRFEDKPIDDKVRGTFHLEAFQVLDEGKAGALWRIPKMWMAKFTDIAFLQLLPFSKSATSYKWRYPKIDLLPPPVGSRIVAFGYHTPKSQKKEHNMIEWSVNPFTSVGEVKQVHRLQRDSCRLPFPCFQTNARYDRGMSGGPVFTDKGHLCGIICSNLPPDGDSLEQEHVSYVTCLWPSMGIEIDLDRDGFPKNTSYPVLDLVRDGFITALGWEKIHLVRDEHGKIIQVGLQRE